jgi:hypothetical protein
LRRPFDGSDRNGKILRGRSADIATMQPQTVVAVRRHVSDGGVLPRIAGYGDLTFWMVGERGKRC